MSEYDDDNDNQSVPPAPRENDGSGVDGERGMPSVNTREGSNKGKILGMVGLGLFGLLLLALAIMPKDRGPKAAQEEGDKSIVNHLPSMPRLFDAPPPPPAAPPPPPAAVKAQSQADRAEADKRKQRLEQRRKAPIIAFGANDRGGDANAKSSNDAEADARIATLKKMLGNYGAGNAGASALAGKSASGGGSLGQALGSTSTPMVQASILPDRNLLITKGTFLDCALETAVDTTVSGFTSCRITHNTYSDNGRVLLLERGSRITGEYKSSQVKAGMSRIFVLWDRVETPNGVVVELDSPGIDALGRSGLPGHVNNHFFKRFGAALMLSVFDDYAKYQIAKQRGSGGSDTLNFGGTMGESQRLAELALQNSIDIPPTLYINQGDHIKVYVARDIDFSTVYRLLARHPEAVASPGSLRPNE